MVTKRRKRQTPIALLWTRRDQLRFIDTVERLASMVLDLSVIVSNLREELQRRPRRTTRPPVIENGGHAEGGA